MKQNGKMKAYQNCHISASSIKKGIFRLLVLILPFFGHAQNIAEKEQIKNDSILAQFQEKDNLKILSLLPSVSYDALNSSINVGFNISQYSNYLQTQRRNKIELAKLENQLKEKSRENVEKAYLRLDKYLSDLQEFSINLMSLSINDQLFEISQGKHKNKEITTEQFLKEKLQLSSRYLGFYSQVSTLEREAKELDKLFDTNTFFIELSNAKQNLLQRGKKLGVLGAEPLSVMLIK
jgi:hypothetical protein